MALFISIIFILVLIGLLLSPLGYYWDEISSKLSNIKPGDIICRNIANPFDYDDSRNYKTVVEVRKGKGGKYIKWYLSDKNGKSSLSGELYYTELYIPSDYKIVNHIEL